MRKVYLKGLSGIHVVPSPFASEIDAFDPRSSPPSASISARFQSRQPCYAATLWREFAASLYASVAALTIRTSRSGIALFITYSSTNHRIRAGVSEYAETFRTDANCCGWWSLSGRQLLGAFPDACRVRAQETPIAGREEGVNARHSDSDGPTYSVFSLAGHGFRQAGQTCSLLFPSEHGLP
jgi:hypothetical protein